MNIIFAEIVARVKVTVNICIAGAPKAQLKTEVLLPSVILQPRLGFFGAPAIQILIVSLILAVQEDIDPKLAFWLDGKIKLAELRKSNRVTMSDERFFSKKPPRSPNRLLGNFSTLEMSLGHQKAPHPSAGITRSSGWTLTPTQIRLGNQAVY